MLKSLKIKNIALIEDLVIEFDDGLNVLTGETGAGKSIIIDSLAFVLGARSDKTLIRKGQTLARVEAVFDKVSFSPEVVEILNDLDIQADDELMIVRTLSIDGRSDARINGSPVTISLLKKITASMVDIYGQQEQVGLLHQKNQLALLDNFGSKTIKPLFEKYSEQFKEYKSILQELDSFGGDEQNFAREKDYLSYVVKEIEDANLSTKEESDLLENKVKLANREKLMSNLVTLENALHNAVPNLSQGLNVLKSVAQYDEKLGGLENRLESAKLELDDIWDFVQEYGQNDGFTEADLDKIEDRLEQYKNLKRKYGSSVEQVQEYLQNCKQKLYELDNREEIRANLFKQKQEALEALFDIALRLLGDRKSVASELSWKIKETLIDLGMPSCKLEFAFSQIELKEANLTSSGLGQVEIMFNANLGGELNPLNKVASGGELSRFMLAVKSVSTEKDTAQTMVFDEIDTGISGKMAQAMSEKMAKISKHNQVLSITHSVQIASMADAHFLIKKTEENGKTVSMVQRLDMTQRLDEIARFMSAGSITDASLQAGKDLLISQQKFKEKL